MIALVAGVLEHPLVVEIERHALRAPIHPETVKPMRQGGVEPRVTLRAYNSLSQPVHVLRLRGRTGERLQALPLRCGTHVAIWDGTIDDPPRLPPGAVYYLNLTVERPNGRPHLATRRVVITQ